MQLSKKNSIHLLVLLYIFFVLSLPGGIKNSTALYRMTTSNLPVTYYFNYYFSFFELPIIFLGLCLYKYSHIIRFGKIYIILVLINITFFILNKMNIFDLKSYEMFLLLLTGFSVASIVLYIAKSKYIVELILDWFTILQFLSQIMSFLTHSSGINGRYSAIGMGSGATAYLASLYLIWTFFARKSKTFFIPIVSAILTILLSGSRMNLLAIVLVICVFFIRLAKRQFKQGNGMKISLIIGFFLPIIIVIIGITTNGFKINLFYRFYDLFQGNFIDNITSDSSYLGRLRSILGSIEIIKENPMGIPFSIYAIEYYSVNFFNMEYPHSTFLSYILLWSPIIAFSCIVYLFKLFFKLLKAKDDAVIFIGYYIAMSIIYGAPYLYVKTYAFIFIVISYIKNNYDSQYN